MSFCKSTGRLSFSDPRLKSCRCPQSPQGPQTWDDLERVAQRLESEPSAAATVVCPYFPVQPWFRRLAALASWVVLCPFDQRWVLRPQQRRFERLGPARWSLCLMAIPARHPGSTAGTSTLVISQKPV